MERRLKILVDGAGGFIGQNLVELLAKGHDVIGLGHREFDITQKLKFPKDIKPDVVIHTATYGVYPFQKDESLAWKTNVDGIKNLLDACIDSSVPLLINTGTCTEYGLRTDTNPLKETDRPYNLSDPYSITKEKATQYCIESADKSSTKIVTLRIFTPYGYHERETRLIPYVILSALNRKKAMLNNPHSTRSFVFVEDVAEAYSKTIESRDRLKSGSLINIGAERQRSTGDVAAIMKKISPDFEYEWNNKLDQRVYDRATNWEADIARANKWIGWKPRYSLEEGIRKTYEWFKERNRLTFR